MSFKARVACDPECTKAYEEWWDKICREGDPQRRPHISLTAFRAGWDAGAAKTEREFNRNVDAIPELQK